MTEIRTGGKMEEKLRELFEVNEVSEDPMLDLITVSRTVELLEALVDHDGNEATEDDAEAAHHLRKLRMEMSLYIISDTELDDGDESFRQLLPDDGEEIDELRTRYGEDYYE